MLALGEALEGKWDAPRGSRLTLGVEDRFRAVTERVARACLRCGRRPDEVGIVVAAKTFGIEAVSTVIAAGARDIGENYVQEARRKRQAVTAVGVRWHLIGTLQRNKAAAAVELFDLIHSLDSIELALALDRAAGSAAKVVSCLIEVNLAEERGKGGVSPAGLERLLIALSDFSHLRVEGLMAIPPVAATPDENRRHFARLRELREDLARLRLPNVHLKELSMGMSGDFETAVEEGATLVRIGSAIFGPRPPKEGKRE